MSKKLLIATCLAVVTVSAAHAGKAPYPVAADGTTNVADCGKAPAEFRNQCISRARPLTAKEIYGVPAKAAAATPAPVKAVKEAAAKTTKIVKRLAASVLKPKGPRGYKIARDGTTNIYQCAKARIDLHDDCLRRARPLTGKQLARFEHVPVRAEKTVVAAAPKIPVAVKPAIVAKAPAKGFAIAKDGTTDINDCGKAVAEFRNECISRARPVKGAEIYKAAKSKS